jgi:hypothetical protein
VLDFKEAVKLGQAQRKLLRHKCKIVRGLLASSSEESQRALKFEVAVLEELYENSLRTSIKMSRAISTGAVLLVEQPKQVLRLMNDILRLRALHQDVAKLLTEFKGRSDQA